MEEDDETQPRPSPEDSLSPDPPAELKTTVKSPPSPPSIRNGLEIVASPPSQAVTGGGSQGRSGGGGGGREDCWSEEATEVLIDAWGERYLELKRGNLKQQHWKEVAEIVNTSSSGKSPKTDIQCKNRIDTVKKKFKQEKAKIAAGADNGRWIFFKKLETLIGGATTATTTASKALVVTPLSSRSSLYQRKAKSTAFKQQASVKRSGDSTRWHFRKRIAYETESESEPDLSADSADDSLPPPPPPPVKSDKFGDGGRRELGEVAMAIIGFAESYEKAETVKLKQLVELEKERMKFAKELELQRMQFLKSQMEMLRNIQEDGTGERVSRSQRSVKDDNGNVS